MRAHAVWWVGLVMIAGCSFVAVHVPDTLPPGEHLHCDARLIAPILDTPGAALFTIGGLALVQEGAHAQNNDWEAGLAITGVGLLYLASAIWGYVETGHCRELDAGSDERAAVQLAEEAEALSAKQRRAEAWDITKLAREAAHAGDCDRVRSAGERVHALDHVFYEAVFARDVAIAACARH